MTDLDKLREALRVYDAGKPARQEQSDQAEEAEDFYHCQLAEKEAVDKVREAFFQYTKGTNSRDQAYLVHPDSPWLRNLVGKV
jgi:hypothetical protein